MHLVNMNPFRLELSSAIQIESSAEHVRQVFADISRWTDWCSVCLDAELVGQSGRRVIPAESEFSWKPGERIRFKFRMAGVGVPFEVAIGHTSSEHSVAWSSTKFTVTAVRTFTFEESGSATVVTDHKLFTSSVLPLRLFYPRPIIRHMSERMLADLKTECERVTA